MFCRRQLGSFFRCRSSLTRRGVAGWLRGLPALVAGAAQILAVVVQAAAPVVDIQESGRKIQLDGFLLEWNEATARPFNGNGRLIWNAVNTSEGFTGFFKNTTSDSCRIVKIRLCSASGSPCWNIDLTNDGVRSSLSAVSAVAQIAGSLYSAEFVVPWSALVRPGERRYRVEITAYAACGDSSRIECQGAVMIAPKASVLTPKIKMQIVFIGVLLAAFLFLQFAVRKKKIRTAKPRR